MPERGLTIPQAALTLGVSYNVIMRRVLTHQLEGWQNERGHWRVSEKSLELYRRQLKRSQASAPVPA